MSRAGSVSGERARGEAERVGRIRSEASSRVTVSRIGRAAKAEERSQARDAQRSKESPGDRGPAASAGDRSSEGGADSGGSDDAASVSDEATVLELLWIWSSDAHDGAISICRWEVGEAEAASDDARFESEPQPGAEMGLQECGFGSAQGGGDGELLSRDGQLW